MLTRAQAASGRDGDAEAFGEHGADHTLPPLLRLPTGVAVRNVAGPMIALGLLRSLYFLTDSFWIGRIGSAPLAALGGSAFALWMISILADLPATGVLALSAQDEGAARRDRIPGTVAQGLWVAAALAVGLAALAPFGSVYYDLLGFPRGSAEAVYGHTFLAVSLLGASGLLAQAVLGAVFRGLGETRIALAVTAFSLVMNAALNPLLIWGPGPLPALGIAGSAWATALSTFAGAVVFAVVLARRGLRVRFEPLRLDIASAIARIGTPLAAAGIAFSFVYVLLGRIINPLGTHNMAGLGVGHRLESLGYMICVGYSVSAAALVGQWIGAGRPDRAAEAAHAAARACALAMVPVAVMLFVGAERLFALFTDDAAIIEAGSSYLRMQVAVAPLMAWEVVYEGGFSGAGRTVPPLVIGFGFTALRLPAAAWLAPRVGIEGVWIAIAASTAVKGVLMAWWFRRGGWERRR